MTDPREHQPPATNPWPKFLSQADALAAALAQHIPSPMQPPEQQLSNSVDWLFGAGAAPSALSKPIPGVLNAIRTKPDPVNTVKAYKLFRVDPKQPGQLFPLFVKDKEPVPLGKWYDAEVGDLTKEGKVKSKIGPLAYRPGWHAGDSPMASHIGGDKAYAIDPSTGDYYRTKKGKMKKVPTTRPPNQVWAEVEYPNDVPWQEEANRRGMNAKGEIVPVNAHITDQIPEDGFYRYKTQANMTGNWLIGGSMKVNRILGDEEVAAINQAAGLADLPRKKPFDFAKYGFELPQLGPEQQALLDALAKRKP